MRRTAGSIRSELEETRAEIKKGVIEMPLEAKESTTAIRRAVSEQINALKELSEIVAKSGRSTDVVRAAAACVRRRSTPAAARRRAAAPSAGTGTPCRRSAPSGDTAAARPTWSARRRQRRASATANGRTPQGGWVRDLLTGASREEAAEPAAPSPKRRAPAAPAQRSPLQVVESLNSLSVDIARAIDHDASIELWDRYRRGERDVFTRRLYTLKGQQTFDEIRRKYQSDGGIPRRGRPLLRGFREAAEGRRPQRPRQHHDADLPDVGHRQGLHDAGPRQRPPALISVDAAHRAAPSVREKPDGKPGTYYKLEIGESCERLLVTSRCRRR